MPTFALVLQGERQGGRESGVKEEGRRSPWDQACRGSANDPAQHHLFAPTSVVES